jgi:hypothetical protein
MPVHTDLLLGIQPFENDAEAGFSTASRRAHPARVVHQRIAVTITGDSGYVCRCQNGAARTTVCHDGVFEL